MSILIKGIDTPQGSYTYHYEAKDFDLFECEELPVAKHWDGHTEKDVTRLLSLPAVRPVVRGKWTGNKRHQSCSECHMTYCVPDGQDGELDLTAYHFCPNCGADMREES